MGQLIEIPIAKGKEWERNGILRRESICNDPLLDQLTVNDPDKDLPMGSSGESVDRVRMDHLLNERFPHPYDQPQLGSPSSVRWVHGLNSGVARNVGVPRDQSRIQLITVPPMNQPPVANRHRLNHLALTWEGTEGDGHPIASHL
jgi:hypothetical protein